jgi:hypothetical protein
MKQTFSDYKKQLEDYLIKLDFIYSGDVIKSEQKIFFKESKNKNFSAVFLSEIMCDIYNWSFNKMIEKSKELVIHRNKFNDVYDLMNDYSLNPKILFYSKNSNLNLNLGRHLIEGSDDKGYLPDYFMRRFKLMSFGKEVSAYYSPLIEDSEDDCNFYLVDRPIQSMVWSLQNMEYDVIDIGSVYEHHVNFPIYHCDYDVYKIRVIDTQKIREEKINTLLNGN